MTTAATPPAEQYHEPADYSWTETEFEMLERHDLHGEVISPRRDRPVPRVGQRLRCLHDRQTHTAVASLMGGQSRGPGGADPGQPGAVDADVSFFPVDVSCGCGANHPGAPAGQAGCGVSFRFELPLQPAGSTGRPRPLARHRKPQTRAAPAGATSTNGTATPSCPPRPQIPSGAARRRGAMASLRSSH